jgi:hypothetical protein
MEWKDKYLKIDCPRCGTQNHVIVTCDGAKSSSQEVGLCYSCEEPVHSETCFMVWVAPTRKEVERRVARAAGLARVL